MRVWRLARRIHAALDGEGARRAGGRWNSVGVPMIYTASTLSLAALELLVHVDSDLIPSDLTAFCLEAPDRLFTEHIAEAILPRGWRSRPDRCRSLGDTWAREHRSAILAVPSAVVPTESNYLINPLHPDAGHVQVVERRGFSFDPRLF